MPIKYQSTVDRLESRIAKHKERLDKSKEPANSRYRLAVERTLNREVELLDLILKHYTIVPDPVN